MRYFNFIFKAVLIIIFMVCTCFATFQNPDILIYNNQELVIDIVANPTPIQLYFYQSGIEYPFTCLNSANYRGHIATWIGINDSLFLKSIRVIAYDRDPNYYNIKSNNVTNSKFVFADWFSGIIEGQQRDDKYNHISSIYFYIKNGIILEKQKYNADKIHNFYLNYFKDIENDYYKEDKLLFLSKNYMEFSSQLSMIQHYDDLSDDILYHNELCKLSSNLNKLSPIFDFYEHSFLNWPYNWENLDSSGVPICSWVIEDKKMFLKNIVLSSGYGTKQTKVKLDTEKISKYKKINNKIFADWITGVYIITHYETDSELNIAYDKVLKYTIVRIKNGKVTKKREVDKYFNFNKIPKNISRGLKKLLNDL